MSEQRGLIAGARAILRAVWPRPAHGPDQRYFEDWDGRSQDPWDYESDYEQARFRRTIDLLDGRRFARGLELGCSAGTFTQMLAPRCDELLAVDISSVAVERARALLNGTPGVTIERRTLPGQMPAGPFDLIVCSDVLVYLNRRQLLATLRRLEDMLAPGGMLVAVDYRPKVRIQPLTGDELHDLLKRHTRLASVRSFAEGQHRYDSFVKQPG